MNSRDYVLEMYLTKIEARLEEIVNYYNNRAELGSIDKIKRVFSSTHSGLSDALASVLEALDLLEESFNESKRSN